MCKIELTNTQEHKNHSHKKSLFRIQAVSFLKGPVVSSPGLQMCPGVSVGGRPSPSMGVPRARSFHHRGNPQLATPQSRAFAHDSERSPLSTESCKWESIKDEPRVKAQICLRCLLQLLSQGHPKLEEIVSLPGLAQGPPLAEAFRCRAWCWCQTCSGHRCPVTKSCPPLCDPTDCSPPGSSVHGVS